MKLQSLLVVLAFILVATGILRYLEPGSPISSIVEGYDTYHSSNPAECDGPSGCPRLPTAVGCGQETVFYDSGSPERKSDKDCLSGPPPHGADLPGGFDTVIARPKSGCGGCGGCYSCGWNNSVSGDGRYQYAPEDLKGKSRVYKYPHYYGYGTGSGFHYGEPYYTRTVSY